MRLPRLRLAAVGLLTILLSLLAGVASATAAGELDQATSTLATRTVYYSAAYTGNVRSNDTAKLERDIGSIGEPVKVAFLPADAASESPTGQTGVADVLLQRLVTQSPGWQGSVAVVLPGVIVTASNSVPAHSSLLTDAANHHGKEGNVGVIKEWAHLLHDSHPQPPNPIWGRLASALLITAIMAIVGFLISAAIRRWIRLHRASEAKLKAEGLKSRHNLLSQQVARWREANDRTLGQYPDPQIGSWLDACNLLLSKPPTIERLDQVEDLLTQIMKRQTETLERQPPRQ